MKPGDKIMLGGLCELLHLRHGISSRDDRIKGVLRSKTLSHGLEAYRTLSRELENA